MQDQFCDKLTVLIEQAPDPQTSTELSRILSRCKAGGDGEAPAPEASTLDSGGGGNTNPPQPGQPPKPPIKGG